MDIPKDIKCVIFDMADTLANFPIDYPSMRSDLSLFIAPYGLKSDFKPIIQDIRGIAKDLNKKELIRDMFDIIDRYETQSIENSTPLDNTIELYKKCIKAKKKVAILTRNGDRMVKKFLAHYALPSPQLIVSRDSCANLKPHTEQFDCLNAFFGFKTGEYMLVGDGDHDRHLAEKTRILFLDVNKIDEKSRLETIASSHNYGEGFNGILMEYRFKSIRHYLKSGKSILELGPAEGYMTKQLVTITRDITVVDGSLIFLNKLKDAIPCVKTVHSLFESLKLKDRYDAVLLCHILEHVKDPVRILKNIKKNCHKETVIVITVPNAYSIHRLLGVDMGLIQDVHELNDSDKKVGHRRVYDFGSLEADIKKAGFRLVEKRGIFYKPFSNAQMESLSDEQLAGFYRLGERFPENCAELMVVCEKK